MDKDNWIESIVFTTSNNSFGQTEIIYLENRFCDLGINEKRYSVKNGNDPSSGLITEEKESELEDFVDYAKMNTGTLGHKIVIPVVAGPTMVTNDIVKGNVEPVLHLKTTKAKATGRLTIDGFVVLKNSELSPNPTKIFRITAISFINNLQTESILRIY